MTNSRKHANIFSSGVKKIQGRSILVIDQEFSNNRYKNLKPFRNEYSDTINAQSTISLLKKIESKHPESEYVYAICDNARYYRSKKVKEYLENSKLKLLFLPPYSPNLNLIERLWKYFRKKVLYNKYYETFDEFKKACKSFFRRSKKYKKDISSLLTENFQIIGKKPKTISQ
ncbi:MAG: hypothetical protein GY941_10590 [Planctomycetes bacterium]|nr:hypothetical protein [Planctomycetota bacterium]